MSTFRPKVLGIGLFLAVVWPCCLIADSNSVGKHPAKIDALYNLMDALRARHADAKDVYYLGAVGLVSQSQVYAGNFGTDKHPDGDFEIHYSTDMVEKADCALVFESIHYDSGQYKMTTTLYIWKDGQWVDEARSIANTVETHLTTKFSSPDN